MSNNGLMPIEEEKNSRKGESRGTSLRSQTSSSSSQSGSENAKLSLAVQDTQTKQ